MDRSRLEAFSDGVFAVAITLLALNLTVAGPGHGKLLDQLGSRWPAFLAYLISFFMIGIVWVNHHVLVRAIAAVDRTLLFLNLVLLLFVVLIPFATATVADYLAAHGLDAQVSEGRDDAVRRGVPRHVGRLRLDLRMDAARPSRVPAGCRRRSTGRRGRGSSAAGSSTWSRSSSRCSTPSPSFVLIALVAVYYIVERTPAPTSRPGLRR